MKLDTFTVHKWLVEVWVVRARNDANGTLVYEKQGVIKGNLTTGLTQSVLFTAVPVEYGALLRNVTNDKGETPFIYDGSEIPQYVTSSDPLMDIYGHLTGFRQVVRRTPPVEFRGIVL